MTPRFDEPVQAGVKYAVRPGAYAILLRGARLLTTFQSEPNPEFQLPGGGIDAGESPVQALHREVLEETGWRMEVQRKVGIFQRFTYMPDYDMWAHKFCHIYLCRPARQVAEPTEACHTTVWMSPEEACGRLANGGDRFYLSRALRGSHLPSQPARLRRIR